MGVGFVKEVGFKVGMKERGSTEWWFRLFTAEQQLWFSE